MLAERRLSSGGAAGVAVTLAACCVAVGLWTTAPHRAALLSEPFDSNLPVQWDSSASVDLDGLSRYYSAPTQKLGADSDWDEKHWSPEHYINVAASRVDDVSAKGIWKNKDEAWDGIDKVLPTDTRYEYQTLHTGHGQEAKMEAFLDHAHHQLTVLQDQLPKLAADKDSKEELDTLRGVIRVGKDALEKIERDTVMDDAASSHVKVADELSDKDLGLSDKFKVVKGKQLRQQQQAPKPLLDIQPDSVLNIDASDPAVWGGGDPFKNMGKPSFHRQGARRAGTEYENSRAAKSDMDSYFQSLDASTQRENRRNARRAGEPLGANSAREEKALEHSTSRAAPVARELGAVQGAQQQGAVQQRAALGARRKLQALRFVGALSRVLRPRQVPQNSPADSKKSPANSNKGPANSKGAHFF